MSNIDRNVNSFMRSRASAIGSYEDLRVLYELEPEELDPYLVNNPPSSDLKLFLAGSASTSLYTVQERKNDKNERFVKVETTTRSTRAANFLHHATLAVRDYARSKAEHYSVGMDRFVFGFMTDPGRLITTHALDRKESLALIAAGVVLPYLYTYEKVTDAKDPVSSRPQLMDRVASYFKRKMRFDLGHTEPVEDGSTDVRLKIDDPARVREALLSVPVVASLPVTQLFRP